LRIQNNNIETTIKEGIPGLGEGLFVEAEDFDLPEDYAPSEDEPYMNPRQLKYFEKILLLWKEQLARYAGETIRSLREESRRESDQLDQSSLDAITALRIRSRDREWKLAQKIESALQRIEEGTYGYCEETGEEIGLKRLEARPIATLCLEAQQWHEKRERQYRKDRSDR
jgi:DnaK suppressor protein